MIEFSGVFKKFQERTALSAIDLKLPKGQTHVFLGSSGSGKSTMLRLLSGLTTATAGEISIDGAKVVVNTTGNVSTKIGYVVQEGGLFPHLTALQNVTLQAETQKWSREKIKARVQELTVLVQLNEGLLTQYPAELSGGQRQRVALMRALMMDPDLILLDEPLAALDPLVRSELQHELKRIFNVLKKTVIIVTHDINEAAYFGHTLSLFHEGQLLQHGTFSDLALKPESEFVTKFLRAQTPPPEVMVLSR